MNQLLLPGFREETRLKKKSWRRPSPEGEFRKGNGRRDYVYTSPDAPDMELSITHVIRNPYCISSKSNYWYGHADNGAFSFTAATRGEVARQFDIYVKWVRGK